MDLQQVLADGDLKTELLDRLNEVLESAPGGFEGFDGGVTRATIAGRILDASEGNTDDPGGLEAIILPFVRPSLMVQDSNYASNLTGFAESGVLSARLEAARHLLAPSAAGVGRINLRHHRQDWVGTGWMVAPEIAVTNRHVAEKFAERTGPGFAFRKATDELVIEASIDWRREYARDAAVLADVVEVLWIQPDAAPDVALLRVQSGSGGLPTPLSLMSAAEIAETKDQWVAVIGYPSWSAVNSLQDQQRIFEGIYGVKRLAPGQVTSLGASGEFDHDATTLGGNSGSAVIHLDSGKAVGLHAGGFEGKRNYAVQATVISDLLDRYGSR